MQKRVGACETDIYMCNVSAAWGCSNTALSVLPSLDAKGSGPGCSKGESAASSGSPSLSHIRACIGYSRTCQNGAVSLAGGRQGGKRRARGARIQEGSFIALKQIWRTGSELGASHPRTAQTAVVDRRYLPWHRLGQPWCPRQVACGVWLLVGIWANHSPAFTTFCPTSILLERHVFCVREQPTAPRLRLSQIFTVEHPTHAGSASTMFWLPAIFLLR
jgi:hypothetical protein